MKNFCLIIKNQSYYDSRKYQNIANEFIGGGYNFEELAICEFENKIAIDEKIVYAKQKFDNIFVICPDLLYNYMKGALENFFKTIFLNDFYIADGEKRAFLIVEGENSLQKVQNEITPYLNKIFNIKYDRLIIKAVGVPENKLKQAISLAEEISKGSLVYNVTNNFSDITLDIIYNSNSTKMMIDEVYRTLVSDLRDYIYALSDTTLAKTLFELLKLRKMRLAVAESFTGGGVASKLVEVSGVSETLLESVVAYSNQAKMSRLNVSEYTLIHHGAVSDETAYEMSAGLIANGCDLAIATTGIAGPNSDNTKKPVGLCYISTGTAEEIVVKQYQLSGDRENITKTAINYALFQAYLQIK